MAMKALLDGGASVSQPNESGSTPLYLAEHSSVRSGSGTPQAREQQEAIIQLLLERGAALTTEP